MDNLGEKIRSERLKKPLTLKQLAQKTKLSVSFLSEIERGLAQPSMVSLRSISQALGISLLHFQESDAEPVARTENHPLDIPPYPKPERYITDVKVVRVGQRKKLAYPGRSGFYELLTPDLNRKLEVLYWQMEPGLKSGPKPIVDPPGEKCLIILSGSLTIKVAGQVYQLDKGDSISYPADAPIWWQTNDREAVETILIIS